MKYDKKEVLEALGYSALWIASTKKYTDILKDFITEAYEMEEKLKKISYYCSSCGKLYHVDCVCKDKHRPDLLNLLKRIGEGLEPIEEAANNHKHWDETNHILFPLWALRTLSALKSEIEKVVGKEEK